MDTEDFRLYDLDEIYMPDNLKLFYENGKPVPFTGIKHPKNGILKIFDRKRNLVLEITYKNNKKNGANTFYFENSNQIEIINYYKDDNLDGICEEYNENGILIKQETFVDGVKEGVERIFDEDGILIKEIIYAHNKEISSKKFRKNIFYEKPEDTRIWAKERTDKNGNTFWLNWSRWLSPIEINSQIDIKNLPSEISNLFSKWKKLLKDSEIIKRGEKSANQCPIKNVSLYFIFDDDIYKLNALNTLNLELSVSRLFLLSSSDCF